MIMIPTTNAIRCQADIGILHLLKKIATENNVNIRILAPLKGYSVEQQIQNVLSCSSPSSLIQLRNVETSSATKSTIIIIDRKESLVTELNDDSKDTFTAALGFATYSNSRSTVLSYVSIFESFWLQTEMYKKVKETERMQKEFIGIAAHELRNPIQPILGLAEILQDIILTYLVNGTSQGIILRTERGHMTEDLKKALLCLTAGLITLRVFQRYRLKG